VNHDQGVSEQAVHHGMGPQAGGENTG